jgi:hypothetical protein
MSSVPAITAVVSIEEIDDYFNARGAWNGRRFELASTPAKRCLLWRTRLASWMMRAGWAVFTVLAVPAIAATSVLAATILASAFPRWFPEWLAQIWTAVSCKPRAYRVTPEMLAMAIPVFLWTTSLLLTRTMTRIRVLRDRDNEADRIEFLEPLIAGGLVGCPNALVVYPDGDEENGETFCLPFLKVPEQLPADQEPHECHLVQAAAHCLLLETAYRVRVRFGVLRYDNRVVSFVFDAFARRRTQEILDEIRKLQSLN